MRKDGKEDVLRDNLLDLNGDENIEDVDGGGMRTVAASVGDRAEGGGGGGGTFKAGPGIDWAESRLHTDTVSGAQLGVKDVTVVTPTGTYLKPLSA